MDDVCDEPALRGAAGSAPDADFGGVWGEPALAGAAAADAERKRHRAWLDGQWSGTPGKARLGVFFLLCVFSGLAAVVCAILKTSVELGMLALVIAAPLAEETGKSLLPLMVLEKRPWLFGSYSSIVLVGALSGAVFASVENVLYFFMYIPADELTAGTVLWRLTVCTALHTGCAALACSGLARAWKRARDMRAEFEMSAALPRIVAAIAVHGLYNFGALLYAIASR